MRFDTLKGVFGWPRPFDVGGNLLRNAGAVHVQSVRVEGQRWPARRVNEPVDTARLTRRFCPTVLDVRLSLSGISIDIRYITVYNNRTVAANTVRSCPMYHQAKRSCTSTSTAPVATTDSHRYLLACPQTFKRCQPLGLSVAAGHFSVTLSPPVRDCLFESSLQKVGQSSRCPRLSWSER